MRWIRAAAVASLIAGLVVLIPAAPACACSCAGFTAEEALANADAAFAGTAVAVKKPWRGPASSGADPVTVTFAVAAVYKGTIPANARVQTPRDGPACGYSFTEGSQYLVHVLAQEDGTWTTSLCSGNQRLAPGIAWPAGGYAPAPAVSYPFERSSWPLIAGAAVVTVAAVITLFALRRRHRGRAPGDPA